MKIWVDAQLPPAIARWLTETQKVEAVSLTPLAHLVARASKRSQICLTTHAEPLATAIAKLTGAPAIRLEKVDGETRAIRE